MGGGDVTSLRSPPSFSVNGSQFLLIESLRTQVFVLPLPPLPILPVPRVGCLVRPLPESRGLSNQSLVVGPAPAEWFRIGQDQCLAAVTLDHDAFGTPNVRLPVGHALRLVVPLDVIDHRRHSITPISPRTRPTDAWHATFVSKHYSCVA